MCANTARRLGERALCTHTRARARASSNTRQPVKRVAQEFVMTTWVKSQRNNHKNMSCPEGRFSKLGLDLELDDDFHSADLDVLDEVGARCRFGTRFYCRKLTSSSQKRILKRVANEFRANSHICSFKLPQKSELHQTYQTFIPDLTRCSCRRAPMTLLLGADDGRLVGRLAAPSPRTRIGVM